MYGRALLLSLDCSTLLLIHSLYCGVLSKEVPATIIEVFGMTRPGIEPRSPEPLGEHSTKLGNQNIIWREITHTLFFVINIIALFCQCLFFLSRTSFFFFFCFLLFFFFVLFCFLVGRSFSFLEYTLSILWKLLTGMNKEWGEKTGFLRTTLYNSTLAVK